MFPMHQIPTPVGNTNSKCKSIMKTHIMSGDDCMSKIGSKFAALMHKPEYFLRNFGNIQVITEDQISSA